MRKILQLLAIATLSAISVCAQAQRMETEPSEIELYTFNTFYSGAAVRITNTEGKSFRGVMPVFDFSTVDMLTVYSGKSVRIKSPGNLLKGYTVTIRTSNGKFLSFTAKHTGQGLVGGHDASVYLLVSGSHPAYDFVPQMQVVWAGERIWPKGYEPRAVTVKL